VAQPNVENLSPSTSVAWLDDLSEGLNGDGEGREEGSMGLGDVEREAGETALACEPLRAPVLDQHHAAVQEEVDEAAEIRAIIMPGRAQEGPKVAQARGLLRHHDRVEHERPLFRQR
jgi:hypothetical protein